MIAALLLILAQGAGTTQAAEVGLARAMENAAEARRELGRSLCNDTTRDALTADADRKFARFQQAFEQRFGHKWQPTELVQARGSCELPAGFGRTFADYENSLNRLDAAFAAY
jgi:hypothetical protein